MRTYCYNAEGAEHEMSEEEILAEYWPYWEAKMKKSGKEDLITKERCIEDWVVVNWAWEK